MKKYERVRIRTVNDLWNLRLECLLLEPPLLLTDRHSKSSQLRYKEPKHVTYALRAGCGIDIYGSTTICMAIALRALPKVLHAHRMVSLSDLL